MNVIFCIGDSHISSLGSGFQYRLFQGMTGEFQAWRFLYTGSYIDMKTKAYVFDDSFDSEFASRMSGVEISAIFLCLGGAEHSFLSLARPWPFDVFMPIEGNDTKVDLEGQVIPFEVMLATCTAAIARAIPMDQHLKTLTNLPMYQVLPPPPPASDDYILANGGTSFQSLLDRHGLTPGYIRQKVWRACLIAARKMYGELGVFVIEPPSEAFDQGGLAQQFCADVVHGNGDYGALVIDRVIAIASQHLGEDAARHN